MLTHACQTGILPAWTRNQNTPRCGLLRKICKRLKRSEKPMGVSLIWRRVAWVFRSWHGGLWLRAVVSFLPLNGGGLSAPNGDLLDIFVGFLRVFTVASDNSGGLILEYFLRY